MNFLRSSRWLSGCCFWVIAFSVWAQTAGSSRPGLKVKSGGYVIESSPANLTATRADGSRVVFDAGAQAKATWADFVRKSNGGPMQAQFTYRLLSVAGPYLSIEQGSYCDCGGAHPTAVKQFRTVDLDRSSAGSPASAALTAVFPERAIFTALTADGVVAKALGKEAKPASMTELLDRLADAKAEIKDCAYGFPEDLLSKFAFYNTENGSVSVRLSLPAAVEVCRGQMIQLGLTLSVPEDRRELFIKAKDGQAGLLMVNAPSTVVSFKFSQGASGKQ